MTTEEEAPAVPIADIMTEVAEKKWGPAITKAIKEGDGADFEAMFSPRLVEVVIQGADGREACFTISNVEEGATMDWKTFIESSKKELTEQDYLKTGTQCLGVLGRRCIMEHGRFNSKGEVYHENIAVLTFNIDGKIVAYEAFSDPNFGALADFAKPIEK